MITGENDPKIIAVKYNLCPTCGYVADNWKTLVLATLPQHKFIKTLNQWGKEQTEVHKCPLCETYFKFQTEFLGEKV